METLAFMNVSNISKKTEISQTASRIKAL